MTLSDSLLAACHFTVLAYRFAFYDSAVRGRVSLVPDTTFIACRSLYTGGFFRAACPYSSHVPWPSPIHTRLGILLTLTGFKLTMRQDSLHVAACNVASPYWAFHRASPLGSHHQVPANYEAVWSLPRADSHRLVVPSFARRAVAHLTLTFDVQDDLTRGREITVFFSYSHKDETMRDELEKHLSIMKRNKVISTWHDRKIDAGSDLDSTVDEAIRAADINLLLVSVDFLASDYCYDVEMNIALERHKNNDAKVVPIILRPCNWVSAPFSKLLVLKAWQLGLIRMLRSWILPKE